MSIGETEIYNLLVSKDIMSTVSILRKLGIKIRKKENCWIVNGVGTCGFKQPNQVLDAGNSCIKYGLFLNNKLILSGKTAKNQSIKSVLDRDTLSKINIMVYYLIQEIKKI